MFSGASVTRRRPDRRGLEVVPCACSVAAGSDSVVVDMTVAPALELESSAEAERDWLELPAAAAGHAPVLPWTETVMVES